MKSPGIDDWLENTGVMVERYDLQGCDPVEKMLTPLQQAMFSNIDELKRQASRLLSDHIFRLFPSGGGRGHMQSATMDLDGVDGGMLQLELVMTCGCCDEVIGRMPVMEDD